MVSTHMRGAVIPTSFHNGFPRASILRVWHTVPRFAFTTNQSKGTVRHIVKITLDLHPRITDKIERINL